MTACHDAPLTHRTEAVQAALRSVQFQTPDEERQVKRRLMELREELRIRDAHDQNRFVEPTADPLPFVNPADIDNYLRTPGEAGRGGPLQVPPLRLKQARRRTTRR